MPSLLKVKQQKFMELETMITISGDGLSGFNDITTPKEIFLSKVIDISSGHSHTLALLSNGSVCTFGYSLYGRLGRNSSDNTDVMVCIPSFGGNSKISAGGDHSLVLSSNNNSYSFGSNFLGQLGLKDNINREFPNKISVLNVKGAEEVITKISAGSFHSLILTEKNEVYVFGSTKDGQLGIGSFSTNGLSIPTKVSISNMIKEISAGESHSILLDLFGNIYTAGSNDGGQLGTGDNDRRNIFKVINSIGNVSSISAGKTSSVVIINTNIYTFGDIFGYRQDTPKMVLGFSNISIAQMEHNHLLVVHQNGSVFGCGSNQYGQLGLGDEKDIYSLTKLKASKIFNVGVGNEHGHCSHDNPGKCICEEGYAGKHCNVKLCPFPGIPVYCSDFGNCMNSTCICQEGYVGDTCETPVCAGLNATQNDVCMGRGECNAPEKCECDFGGYAGNNCEYHACGNIPFNHTNVCSSQGNCTSPNRCVCGQNYTGDYCESALCFGISQHAPSSCSYHGKCLGPNNCLCDPNYSGENCEIFQCYGIDSKNPSVCSGRGICYSSDNCNCFEGSGNQCQFYGFYLEYPYSIFLGIAIASPVVICLAFCISFLFLFPIICFSYRWKMVSYLKFVNTDEEKLKNSHVELNTTGQ
eukprot:gene8049-12511_t